ncbi:MAG: hypothetical protein HY735_26790 [Verrucomicrobia bacterium]|nr:hypothetical protein [Verrucomicrobiota bacterium]
MLKPTGLAAQSPPSNANSGSLAEESTKDLFKGDFPPVVYGENLTETEATIQAIVERVFRDDDGILRSSVNGATMTPLRVEDVRDRPQGLGTFAENSAIPREIKPLWTNYENAGQASGTYLEALCAKARLIDDARVRELASRTVAAIVILWENAAATKDHLGGGGRGWLPKPYDGIQRVLRMHECSADQYCDVTLGLHSYYLSLADENEKRKIEEIIVSFADWWYDHDYAGVYFGQAIWWKRLKSHSMAASYFLYLNALAQSWKPSRKFEHGFEIWWGLKGALQPPGTAVWVTMHGITLNCLERLITLRPDLADEWRSAAAYQARLLAASTGGTAAFPLVNAECFGADYLATAHRLLPSGGYDRLSRRCLEATMRRECFYHIKRGRRLADMDKRYVGDDYRNMFMCEDHTHWLNGYWQGRVRASLEK